MTWTTPITWAGTPDAADFNAMLRDNPDFLNTSMYRGCRVGRSTGQTFSASTETVALWDTEEWDTDAIHDTATNTGRFTVPAALAGKIEISGHIAISIGTDENIVVRVRKNGSTYLAQASLKIVSGVGAVATVWAWDAAVASDYYEITMWKDGAGVGSLRDTSSAAFHYLGA